MIDPTSEVLDFPRMEKDTAQYEAVRSHYLFSGMEEDVFDALASRRPYKEPCSFEDTMAILEQGRGTHFDPQLLEAFEGIAQSLYERFAGAEGSRVERELEAINRKYFHTAVGDLAGAAP